MCHAEPASNLALRAFIVDVESEGEATMGTIDGKAERGATGSGLRPTLCSLYEAARKEVLADPAAALRKYQPTWLLTSPSASPARPADRARKPAR